MDFVTPRLKDFTRREDIIYHPDIKMWEVNGKFFDLIFSLLSYLNLGSQYENFMASLHPYWGITVNERKKFKQFEEDYLNIDTLFNKLANLKESKKYKGMYSFSADTEFTFKNRRYKVQKGTIVQMLYNFADQPVGIALKQNTQKGIIVNVGPNLFYRPFKSELMCPVIALDLDDRTTPYYHKRDVITFKQHHFPYLKTYLKQHPDAKFTFKSLNGNLPKPTIILEFPWLRYMFYNSYKINDLSLFEWIVDYPMDKSEADYLYRALDDLDPLTDVHPDYFFTFQEIKDYLNQVRKEKTLVSMNRENRLQTLMRKRARYIMKAVFKEEYKKGRYCLKSKLDGTEFYYDINNSYENWLQIKKHFNKHNVFNMFDYKIGRVYKGRLRKGIIEYLNEKYEETVELRIQYEKSTKRWVVRGRNGTLYLKSTDKDFRLNKDHKDPDSYISFKFPITNKVKTRRNTKLYNKFLEMFAAPKTQDYAKERMKRVLHLMLMTLPWFYMLKQPSKIRMHFVYDEVREIFDNWLKQNYFVNIDNSVNLLYTYYKTPSDAYGRAAAKPEILRERLRKLSDKDKTKLRRAIWAEQKAFAISLLHSCKSVTCIEKKLRKLVEELKKK